MERFELVVRDASAERTCDISFLNREAADKARAFHRSYEGYQETPLVELDGLAETLGVAAISVKDESDRFGLNAFKALGASYAMGNYLAQKLGIDPAEMTFPRAVSEETRKQVGEVTFVTATDGNHGRGVAWTARQLGQRSVVYMPRGSALERLENIRAEGARADIMDMNYDDAVRLAREKAETEGWALIQDTAWEGYTEVPAWIMQGYTTMAAEAVEQMKQPPTHVFLQAGVGSMAGAVAGFLANYYGENKPCMIVVEPQKADCVFRTAKANDGKLRVVTGDMDTIMAGLACGEPCTIAWEVLRDYADAYLSCPDYAAADGMRILAAPVAGDVPVVSGESGASAFGCAVNLLTDPELAERKERLGLNQQSRLLFISTEGATDRKNYRNVVWFGKHSRPFDLERK